MRFALLAILLTAANVSGGVREGESVDALIAKGDDFDRLLEGREALQFYLPASKIEPNNVDLLCKIARQYRHMMSDTTVKQEKLRLGYLSLDAAQHAAQLAPKNSEAQLSPAISYGKMLPFMKTKDQVDTTPRIKTAVDRAIALDPNNDLAWHILGRWNRVLADINSIKRVLAKAIYGDLPVTTNEEAERCLKKAIAINPHRLMHYIELGRIYAQMGRNDEAKQYLQKGLSMPDQEKDDPEQKDLARQTLKKMGGSPD